MPDLPAVALPTSADVLTAGLQWLYETVQPDDAHTQHHGELLAADNNRTYRFVPRGALNLPVVVVDVTKVEWIETDPFTMEPLNPLESGELAALAAELERRGYPARDTWNGAPGAVTGSIGLARAAHPTQVAAVERYHRGCPVHPERSVFCDCPSWRAESARVVHLPKPGTIVAARARHEALIDLRIAADSIRLDRAGGCGACDLEPGWECVACGKCNCDTHENCVRPTVDGSAV